MRKKRPDYLVPRWSWGNWLYHYRRWVRWMRHRFGPPPRRNVRVFILRGRR